MKISLIVAGRAKTGPINELVKPYLDRINNSGRSVGIGPATITEYEPRRGADRLIEAALARTGTLLCTLQVQARLVSSEDFSKLIGRWRDNGCREAIFLIGGDNGIAPRLEERADCSLSFGRMTFTHMLTRILLAEQLYRAVSIMRGSPYHRG